MVESSTVVSAYTIYIYASTTVLLSLIELYFFFNGVENSVGKEENASKELLSVFEFENICRRKSESG